MLQSTLRGVTAQAKRIGGVLLGLALLDGCAQTPTPTTTTPTSTAVVPPPPTAVVVTPPPPVAPEPRPINAPALPPAAAAQPATPAVASVTRDSKKVATTEALTPTGVNRYQCLLPGDTTGKGTPIELPANTLRVCSRFPAMGPCQYERDACRAKGGRVIRFDGVEIDKDVEREYDKQVQRFRLNAG